MMTTGEAREKNTNTAVKMYRSVLLIGSEGSPLPSDAEKPWQKFIPQWSNRGSELLTISLDPRTARIKRMITNILDTFTSLDWVKWTLDIWKDDSETCFIRLKNIGSCITDRRDDVSKHLRRLEEEKKYAKKSRDHNLGVQPSSLCILRTNLPKKKVDAFVSHREVNGESRL